MYILLLAVEVRCLEYAGTILQVFGVQSISIYRQYYVPFRIVKLTHHPSIYSNQPEAIVKQVIR